MENPSTKSANLYFALVGTGAFVVACAAFASYVLSLGMEAEPLAAQEVARRMIIILFLVVTVFELALLLLNRVVTKMDATIKAQNKELEKYAEQLETIVTDQLTKIAKIKAQVPAATLTPAEPKKRVAKPKEPAAAPPAPTPTP